MFYGTQGWSEWTLLLGSPPLQLRSRRRALRPRDCSAGRAGAAAVMGLPRLPAAPARNTLSLRLSRGAEQAGDARSAHTHCSKFAHYLHAVVLCIFPLSFFTDLFSLKDVLGGVFDNFDTPQVLPVVQVGPVHVMEAWHGPTGVFKDLTLPALARLCNHFLEKRGRRATILVSTTGDT